MAYIKKSPTGSALIDFLEASTETFTIVFVDNDMTQYNYDPNQIDWDVNSGLIMGNNTSVQSAALGLAHEMGHAAQDINGIYEQHKTNGNFLNKITWILMNQRSQANLVNQVEVDAVRITERKVSWT